jgi:acyl-CoA carboxylase epsilon subunit
VSARREGPPRFEEPAKPVLRVVRGNPTPEEIAAVVSVLTARASAAGAGARTDAAPPETPSGWNDRSRALRIPLPHGPDAWRASARAGR